MLYVVQEYFASIFATTVSGPRGEVEETGKGLSYKDFCISE
jgi:hypothetical protein